MNDRVIYRPGGLLCTRASTLDRTVVLPHPHSFEFDFDSDPETLRDRGRAWLTELCDTSQFLGVVATASESLATAIEAFITDDQTAHRMRPKKLRKLLMSAYSYMVRWQARSTPFGAFAGVTTVEVGASTQVRDGINLFLREPDTAELLDLAKQEESDRAGLARLRVLANNLATVRGGRVVVAVPATTEHLASGAFEEISVPLSPPVTAILALAATSIPTTTVAHTVATQFSVPEETVWDLLARLVHIGVLVTSARPPTTEEFADYWLRHETRVKKDATEAVAQVTHVAGLAPTAQLPQSVVEEAASAASLLSRLSASPFGSPVWRDYLQRFHQRYGAGALVGVRELVGDSGLGYPIGYLGAATTKPARLVTDRDVRFLALVQEAATRGDSEIVLTNAIVDQLLVGDTDDRIVPPRVELLFRIDACSFDEIDQGRFRLWLSGVPRPESSLAGRFMSLLPEETCRQFTDSYPVPGRIAAQLSFPPRVHRNTNVTTVPPLLRHLIPLGEHPPRSDDSWGDVEILDVDDLSVTVDDAGFHLIHSPTGMPVDAYALHALDATVHTPPLARFLAEISGSCRTWWGPIDTGIARTLTYLPRISVGRSVLAPARWILDDRSLPDRQSLDAWLDRWSVPALVEMSAGASHLPLDLRRATDRQLLASHVGRHATIQLTESPHHAAAWGNGAREFLAYFRSHHHPPSPSMVPVPVSSTPIELPGGEIIHATITGNPHRFSDIVTDHLPALVADIDPHATWWFRRDHDNSRPDAEHTFTLTVRPVDDAHLTVTNMVNVWATQLHRTGMIADLQLSGYRSQNGKWGTDLTATEAVFCSDSRAAITELTTDHGLSIDAVTALSMLDIAENLAHHVTQGWAWLTTMPAPSLGPDLDPKARYEAFTANMTDHPDIVQAWKRRSVALTAYRASLQPHRSPQTVLRGLLHEHVARTMGVHPDRERSLIRLARAVAMRRLHTRTST